MELVPGGTPTNQLQLSLHKKRVLRMITFSNNNDHCNSFFKALERVILLRNAIFMYDFHSGTLPSALPTDYFTAVNKRQEQYKTCFQVFRYSSSNRDKLW